MPGNREQSGFCFPSNNYPFGVTSLEEVCQTVETKKQRYHSKRSVNLSVFLVHLV